MGTTLVLNSGVDGTWSPTRVAGRSLLGLKVLPTRHEALETMWLLRITVKTEGYVIKPVAFHLVECLDGDATDFSP
jgi:hypothetical protein